MSTQVFFSASNARSLTCRVWRSFFSHWEMQPAETSIREANCAWVSPRELRQERTTAPVSLLGKGFVSAIGAAAGRAAAFAGLETFAFAAGAATVFARATDFA